MSANESEVSSWDEQHDSTLQDADLEKATVMDDAERTAIRAQLTTLSFEELQALKEKVGARVYREAMFGEKKVAANRAFKRANKNRPKEMSAKVPVPMVTPLPAAKKKTKEVRDPRFDPLCGELDKKQWSQNYSFITELKVKDAKSVEAELKSCDDPEKARQLRRLLQRLNAQVKAKSEVRPQPKMMETQRLNKGASKVSSLVQQYEELKQQGTSRIQRHVQRRKVKILRKSPRVPT